MVSKALDDNACGTVIVPSPSVRVTQMLLALADVVIDLPDGDSIFKAKDGFVPLQFEFAVAFVISKIAMRTTSPHHLDSHSE